MNSAVVCAEIAQALYNPIAYQSQLEQLERRTRQLSVFDDDEDLPVSAVFSYSHYSYYCTVFNRYLTTFCCGLSRQKRNYGDGGSRFFAKRMSSCC